MELQHKGILGILIEEGKIDTIFLFIAMGLCAVIGYLLGSLNFGIILSKLKHGDDIRNYGSGNAGATNMLRTYGKKDAALTFVLDGLKAVVAITISSMLAGGYAAYLAGFAAVLGHMYPVYYHFKGGKGVTTTAIMILMLKPIVFVILITFFLIIVISTKYVSLGSVITAMLYPVLLNSFTNPPIVKAIVGAEKFGCLLAVILAVMIVIKHRANIKRLYNRTESKISLGSKKKDKKAGKESENNENEKENN